ncbi:uncharacterized protein LOC116663534 [Camelus ferus]|uniref:Uncharacterized protein LOC116663534 n=1 Tax=Camelus ferus TaxID=419612 RepID=A0A8B8SYZ8_CAMFR|nr:uncharacterized protein LOC116663534 [Camelus ferus]
MFLEGNGLVNPHTVGNHWTLERTKAKDTCTGRTGHSHRARPLLLNLGGHRNPFPREPWAPAELGGPGAALPGHGGAGAPASLLLRLLLSEPAGAARSLTPLNSVPPRTISHPHPGHLPSLCLFLHKTSAGPNPRARHLRSCSCNLRAKSPRPWGLVTKVGDGEAGLLRTWSPNRDPNQGEEYAVSLESAEPEQSRNDELMKSASRPATRTTPNYSLAARGLAPGVPPRACSRAAGQDKESPGSLRTAHSFWKHVSHSPCSGQQGLGADSPKPLSTPPTSLS